MKLMTFTCPDAWRKHNPIERTIEEYLVKMVRINGGMAIKNDAKIRKGIPDRTVIMPGGIVVFTELKRRGKEMSSHQVREMERLRKMDQYTALVDWYEGVNDLIRWCKDMDINLEQGW